MMHRLRRNLLAVLLALLCAGVDPQSAGQSAPAPPASRPPPTASEKILLLLAHPDDETMIRSFIARWSEAGDQVVAVYLTRGEGGTDGLQADPTPTYLLPPEMQEARKAALAAKREEETNEAARAYGFKRHYFLTTPDDPLRDPVTHIPTRDPSPYLKKGGPWKIDAIERQVQSIAAIEKPDVVVSFFPDQEGTHAHHQATGAIAQDLYQRGMLGPDVRGLYGFYEDGTVRGVQDGKVSTPLSGTRVELSPQLISRVPGPDFGHAYGEIGSRAGLHYASQLSNGTGEFIRNWQTSPDEAIAPVLPTTSLEPLLKTIGDIPGIRVVQAAPDAAACVAKALEGGI